MAALRPHAGDAIYPVAWGDGAELAYISWHGRKRRLEIVRADGKRLTQTKCGGVYDAAWLRSGKALVYLRRARRGSWELRLLRLPGAKDALLGRAPWFVAPVSVHGDFVAVGGTDTRGRQVVRIYSTRLGRLIAASPADCDYSVPSWSPDGRALAVGRPAQSSSGIPFAILRAADVLRNRWNEGR